MSDLLTSDINTDKETSVTFCAASRVKPPRKTDSFWNADRSLSLSLCQVDSNMDRMLRWRSGTSFASVVKNSRLRPISSAISTGDNSAIQAAASSIPNGIPSVRLQISTTVPTLPSSKENPGRTRAALSTKSCTASNLANSCNLSVESTSGP